MIRSLRLQILTPGRKEVIATSTGNGLVALSGLHPEASYDKDDLLALASFFQGLAAMLP